MGNCKTNGRRPLGSRQFLNKLDFFFVFLLLTASVYAQPYLITLPPEVNPNTSEEQIGLTFYYQGEGQTLYLSSVENEILPFPLPKVNQPIKVILSGLGRQGFRQAFTMQPPVGLEEIHFWFGEMDTDEEMLRLYTDGVNSEIYLPREGQNKVLELTTFNILEEESVSGYARGDLERSFRYRPSLEGRGGTDRLFFHPKLLGGRLEMVSLEMAVSSMSLTELPSEGATPRADLGTIYAFSRLAVDLEDYRVFAWSGRPEIKIFVFEDFTSQAAFFKRLAFFVEKRGYKGKLLRNDQLAGLHGWNAHNYRPVDLAEFFNQVKSEGLSLNPEELELRSTLMDWGIILEADQGYQPGQGAILSIAKRSSPVWRQLLLKHEFVHGIYFVSPVFEEKVTEIWGQTPDTFKTLWSSFLAWASYDSSWDYLVINELAGYLLSYEDPEALNEYMQVLLNRALRRNPELNNDASRSLWWETLEWVVPALQDAFYEESGLMATQMFTLVWD
jgi:hypothetical protein